MDKIHICTYAAPFGVVPAEIDEVYPLSQHETALPLEAETIDYVAKQVENYILKTNYEKVVLLENSEVWKGKVTAACERACKRRKLPLTTFKTSHPWSKDILNKVSTAISRLLCDDHVF
jgi:predicted RNA-binding protein